MDKGTPNDRDANALEETKERMRMTVQPTYDASVRSRRTYKLVFGYLALSAVCMVMNLINRWSKPY